MVNNQIQNFDFSGNNVRIMVMNGKPWWVVKDVCEALDLSNPTVAIQRLEEDEVTKFNLGGLVGETNLVNEMGLYSLILGSRKPEAKQFKRWVTHEVLPMIREHGVYMTPETIEKTITTPDFIINLATRLKEEQEKAKSLENEVVQQRQQLKEQEAPVAIYNLAISASNTMSMADVAKSLGTGRNRLFSFLRERQIIMRTSPTPYQSYIDRGYFKVVERPRASGDKVTNDSVTRVTAKGFDYIAKLLHQKIEA